MKRLIVSLVLSLVVLSMCFGMVSCAWSVGGTHVHGPTLGEELTDLKEAHDKGVISDEEYEKAKQSLLKRDEKD